MSTTLTPNMSLVVPGVGTESGPAYATEINGDLSILDGHNHSSGSGVQITPSGLNINANLSIGNNVLLNVGAVNLEAQTSTPSYNASIYSEGVDLYYLDGSGNTIRLTEGGSIVGTAGSIGGLPSGTASVFFSSSTYVFQSATNVPANLDSASIILRNPTLNSFGVTLSPPNSLGANYSLTLPSIPAQTNVMTIDSSGNMGSITYDQVGEGMTATGADAIGESMDSTGANAVANSRTRTIGTSVGLGGVVITASSGTFAGSGNITNLAGTIVTSGRPVYVAIQPDGSGQPMSTLNAENSCLTIYRDGNSVATWGLLGVQPVGIHYALIDNVGAGTHSYIAAITQYPGSSGSVVGQVDYAALTAYEI